MGPDPTIAAEKALHGLDPGKYNVVGTMFKRGFNASIEKAAAKLQQSSSAPQLGAFADKTNAQPFGASVDKAATQPLGASADKAAAQPFSASVDNATAQPLGASVDKTAAQQL